MVSYHLDRFAKPHRCPAGRKKFARHSMPRDSYENTFHSSTIVPNTIAEISHAKSNQRTSSASLGVILSPITYLAVAAPLRRVISIEEDVPPKVQQVEKITASLLSLRRSNHDSSRRAWLRMRLLQCHDRRAHSSGSSS